MHPHSENFDRPEKGPRYHQLRLSQTLRSRVCRIECIVYLALCTMGRSHKGAMWFELRDAVDEFSMYFSASIDYMGRINAPEPVMETDG